MILVLLLSSVLKIVFDCLVRHGVCENVSSIKHCLESSVLGI